ANTLSWQITRIKLQVRRNGTTTKVLSVLMNAADASKHPTGSALDSGTIDTSTVPSTAGGGWKDIPFSNLGNLSPTQSLTVSVTYSSGGSAPGYIEYDQGTSPTNMMWSKSTDSGISWISDGTFIMQLYVYGKVTT